MQTQEREAKENMRRKAKELQAARKEASRRGGKPSPGSYSGFGSGSGGGGGGRNDFGASVETSAPEPVSKPSYTAPSKPSGPSKAMKLGSKTKDVDSFIDTLKSEGERKYSDCALMPSLVFF